MIKKVTFRQLQTTLSNLGFESQTGDGHVIFRHADTGAVLSLPNTTDSLRPIYVKAAAQQVANSGIASASTFEAKLEKVAKPKTVRTVRRVKVTNASAGRPRIRASGE